MAATGITPSTLVGLSSQHTGFNTQQINDLLTNGVSAIDIKQVLAATNTISGSASATTVNFHISGVEIA